MIEKITLHNIIPKVFTGEENMPHITKSEIWLEDVTFLKGERYLISAPSGAGKSSLCSFIACARRDYDGVITYDETDISGFGTDKICDIRRKVISYMPQNIILFPELSVIENIRLKNDLTHHKSDAEITNMMKILDIDKFAHKQAGHCSIGQQQRAQIVMSLCQPFDFLIMDEPVSHLDDNNNDIASELIASELDKQGAGLVTTSVGYPLNIENARHISL